MVTTVAAEAAAETACDATSNDNVDAVSRLAAVTITTVTRRAAVDAAAVSASSAADDASSSANTSTNDNAIENVDAAPASSTAATAMFSEGSARQEDSETIDDLVDDDGSNESCSRSNATGKPECNSGSAVDNVVANGTISTRRSTALNQEEHSPMDDGTMVGGNVNQSDDYESNHFVAATITTTTTTSSALTSNSPDDASSHGTDKDGSAYIEALLSAIETFPTSGGDAAEVPHYRGAAMKSDSHDCRLPTGKVVTSKNTLMSYSTAAASSSSIRRSDGAVMSELPQRPAAAYALPVLVNVVHATQEHHGVASSSPPPLLATVISGPNEPMDLDAARSNNTDSNASASTFTKVGVYTAAILAGVLIIALFVAFYQTRDGEGSRASAATLNSTIPQLPAAAPSQSPNLGLSSDTTPSTNASQLRAILVTDYIKNNTLSTIELVVPTAFQFQFESGEQAALAWLVNYDPLKLWPDTEANRFRLKQRYALLTWISQLSGFDATSLNISECAWHIVASCASEPIELTTVDADVVTEIYTESTELAFTLPPDLGLLSNLVAISVEGLTGSLPSSLGMAWTNLESFDVSDNALTGGLPSLLGTAWTNLETFSVQRSALRGSVPSSLGATWSNLERFELSDNALRGSLPALLGTTWTNLEYFDIDSNTLTGSLPLSLGTTWTNLVLFDVSVNALTGRLPPSMGTSWTNLAYFDVSLNALTGSLPPSMGTSWANLAYFDASFNALTGTIPDFAINWTWSNLVRFHLSGNALRGSLPSFLGTTWTNLEYFEIHNNTLTGSLPLSLGTTWTNLAYFDASFNALTGTIPDLAINWTKLQSASFNNNSLVGLVPTGFCTIATLTSLHTDCFDEVTCSCCTLCW